MDLLTAINQHPWLLEAILLLLGMCVGSFLNVVIFRLPVMMEAQWRHDCSEMLEPERSAAATANKPFNLSTPNSH